MAGYVERDPHDDCYRPTIMVRALSGGFDDEAMVVHVAKPYLTALGAQLARNRAEVERLLHETRTQGFGMAQRTRRASEETSLALPLAVNDRILAALALRYPTAAVPLRSMIEQFLPKMREITTKIAREFAQKAGASAAI